MSSPEELLRILKNPTRRRIVRLLAEKGPLEYSEIMRELGLTSTGRLNYHLEAMRELLEKDELGRYRLNRRGLLAYQLLREYVSNEEEYTIGVHPLALLVDSLPALVVGVVVLLSLLSLRFLAVDPLFLVALIAIIAVVLLKLAYGLAGKPFPYLKVRRD